MACGYPHIEEKEPAGGGGRGWNQPVLLCWEAGKREPNYETTMRLARFFGVSVDRLLGLDEEKKEPTPVSESGPLLYPPEYDLLSSSDKELVDNMIRSLAKKQSAD